jgi:hypothetical protein
MERVLSRAGLGESRAVHPLVANLEHPDHWLRPDAVDRIKLGEDGQC